jgi:hypothetical protein
MDISEEQRGDSLCHGSGIGMEHLLSAPMTAGLVGIKRVSAVPKAPSADTLTALMTVGLVGMKKLGTVPKAPCADTACVTPTSSIQLAFKPTMFEVLITWGQGHGTTICST